MPNLRIISDNAADRAALAASSTAGALAAAALQSDVKSNVWRATSTTAQIVATWTAPESIGAVSFPFCNLSPTATMRVRGYSDVARTVEVLDTGDVPACPARAVTLRGFTRNRAASAYAYGGGAYARAWFAETSVMALVIDLVDTDNAQGYIEAGRLVAGAYWSPANNADYGASMLIQDASKHYRTDAGDLLTDIGTRARKMPLNLSALPPADRTALANIIRRNGMAGPLLISLFPEDVDLELERDHTIYGKLSSVSAIAIPYFSRYSMPLEIEEI